MKSTIQDRKFDSYRSADNDKSKVAVTLEDGLLAGLTYNDIQATYPDSVTENYTYLFDGDIVATIEVTYSDSTKSVFIRARRV